jgi:HEAT repeat protein
MKRLLLGALLVVGALALIPTETWAHGGQFRGPGGSVPPGLREPTDPTPPPPPPPSGGSPPPSSGAPTTPPAGTPPATPTPPTVTPPTGPTDSGTGRPAKGGAGFQDWTFWYHHNKEEIENLKRRLYFRVSSQNPLFQIGGSNVTNRGDETRLTQKKVEEAIIPALIWAMDPKNSDYNDTESAAYLALAKMAKTPDQIKRIRSGLENKKNDAIVLESAALALGLLRRAAPDDQFSARELDVVRTFLFQVFEDAEYGIRTRGFAALAIGLLGDQPTGSADYLQAAGKSVPTTGGAGGPGGDGTSDDARQTAEKVTTERLFKLLKADYPNPDLSIGLLIAIGLQPSSSVSEDQRGQLHKTVLKGQLFDREVQSIIRGNATLTLARVGGDGEINPLKQVMLGRAQAENDTMRSAAIGLGLLGRAVDSGKRTEIAKILAQNGIEKAKDDSVRNFSIISLAYLLQAEVQEGKTDLLKVVGPELLKQGESGKHYQRPFGALALALVVGRITDELEIEAWQEFKRSALKVLRDGLDDQKMDKQGRAAFATALGMARDTAKRARLIEIVADRREDKEFRGYAALALGLIGDAPAEVTKAIAEALRERSSEELRRQAAVALGLLGNPKIGGTGQDAIQLLLEELKGAESQAHKGQVVVALARIGNDKAVDPLVDILKSSKEQKLTRALACAGLGIIGDLEWIPSLSRISRDINYRLSTDILNEVLSIL